jgi:predicted metal-dependent peptidase
MEQNLILDVNRITKKLLISDIFYGLFLTTINKQESKDIPLAAVSVNKSTMDFGLLINPDEWFKYSDEVRYGVLKHEALHLAMFHLVTSDLYSNSKMDNIATDCEINQYIDKAHLPSWGIFLDDLQQKYPDLDFSPNKGRNHYYKELDKLPEEEKDKMGIGDNAKHVWVITDKDGNESDLTEPERESLRKTIEHTIETISEEISKSQGNIPTEIEQLIRNFIKPKPHFNYLNYIRNFVGNSNQYFIKTSKVRENHRFPGQPKTVIKPKSKILVLIDESGSVSQTELLDFLNEIHYLSKKVDIEIRPFDTEVMDEVKYKKNNEFKRTNCGGTSFTAAVDFYNKNNRYNSCIIFTDGQAEEPPACYKKLLWVISSNGSTNAIENHAQWIKIPNN